MSVEAIRGCGYRKVGGLYLCGEGHGMGCDRLPYELKVCPTCGSGVKFSRGFTWLDWLKYAGGHKEPCHDVGNKCPMCHPLTVDQPYGLLWVGESFYTPEAFIKEALEMGVSRRIAAVPRNLKLGKTWVLFAHNKLIRKQIEPDGSNEDVPGVFYAFKPQRAEFLIWESEATEEKLAELEKKHITPVVIPDGDVDHDPKTSLKPKDEEKNKLVFEHLRSKVRGGE